MRIPSFGWGGLVRKQSCLSQKQGLELKLVVAMFTGCRKGERKCPSFEGFAVHTEAEVASQGGKCCLLPIASGLPEDAFYAACLFFQSLYCESTQPSANSRWRYVRNDAVTWRKCFLCQEFGIALPKRLGHCYLDLRHFASGRSADAFVYLRHNVQHNVIVGFVLVMPMSKPVCRVFVQLHVSHPKHTADAHLGIEKIGSRIMIVQTGVKNFHSLSAVGEEGCGSIQLVLPDVME